MLWLALHLPQLSLEAFCATLAPEAARRPIALIAEHQVAAVNAAAAACGVRPGLKRATALALSADLQLAQADLQRDAAALQAVAHVALGFTPAVTLQGDQTVLLDVQASLRYFGGLPALLQRLHSALAPLGHRVQVAAALTALGAALLARWSPVESAKEGISRKSKNGKNPGAAVDMTQGPHTTELPALQRLLADAPVWLLGPGREHWEALQGMGLRTLSDLRHLPRSGLARRFGAGLLDDLDRAFGLQPDPRNWVELPPAFDSRLELFARADTTEQVLFGAAVLLARLVAWAQARRARVAAFSLHMLHEPRHRESNPPATELEVSLAEPALDPAHLQLLLRERLAHVELLAPTLELRLHCHRLVQAEAPNGELFPTPASDSEGLLRLLERLRARLGDDHVLQLLPVADHRPERATRSLPAQGGPQRGCQVHVPAPSARWPLHRPAWLLPEPLPLAERDALPLFEGRPLQLLSGPERIETGWWDGEPATRDYFIAQAGDGSLVWVWCQRLLVQHGEVSWFLQGRFA